MQQKGQGIDRLAVCKARYALVPYLKPRRVDRETQESSSSERTVSSGTSSCPGASAPS